MTQNPAEAEVYMWFWPGSQYGMPQTQSAHGNTLTNTTRFCFLSQLFSLVSTAITGGFSLGSDGFISTLLVFLLVYEGIESTTLLYMIPLQLCNSLNIITACGKRKAPHKKERISSWFKLQPGLSETPMLGGGCADNFHDLCCTTIRFVCIS